MSNKYFARSDVPTSGRRIFSFIYLVYHFLKISAFFEKIALFLKVLQKSCFDVWSTVSLRPRFRDGTECALGWNGTRFIQFTSLVSKLFRIILGILGMTFFFLIFFVKNFNLVLISD